MVDRSGVESYGNYLKAEASLQMQVVTLSPRTCAVSEDGPCGIAVRQAVHPCGSLVIHHSILRSMARAVVLSEGYQRMKPVDLQLITTLMLSPQVLRIVAHGDDSGHHRRSMRWISLLRYATMVQEQCLNHY